MVSGKFNPLCVGRVDPSSFPAEPSTLSYAFHQTLLCFLQVSTVLLMWVLQVFSVRNTGPNFLSVRHLQQMWRGILLHAFHQILY